MILLPAILKHRTVFVFANFIFFIPGRRFIKFSVKLKMQKTKPASVDFSTKAGFRLQQYLVVGIKELAETAVVTVSTSVVITVVAAVTVSVTVRAAVSAFF